MPQIKCPGCQKLLKIKPELAGRVIACSCGQRLRVPTAAASSTSGPAKQQPAGSATATGHSSSPSRSTKPRSPRSRSGEGQHAASASQGRGSAYSSGFLDALAELPLPPDPRQASADDDQVGTNPYAPPAESPTKRRSKHLEDATGGKHESLRRKHIRHEANIRGISTLYLLQFGILLVGGIILIVFAIFAPSDEENLSRGFAITAGVVYLILGPAGIYFAMELRRCKSWARGVAVVLSAIGLLGVPLGTLLHAYFLWLLLSEQGQIVFSDKYRRAIKATPHIKPPVSLVVKIVLGLLVVLLVMMLIIMGIAFLVGSQAK